MERINQHSARGINQAGERQARQSMRKTAGQAQTLRETGGNRPRENTRFCPFAVFSSYRSDGRKRPEALRRLRLRAVCRWSAGRMAARCRVQIMRGGEYAIKNDGRRMRPPCPLYASSPRRRKRRRAHGAGISGARPGRGAVFTCPRPMYLYIES